MRYLFVALLAASALAVSAQAQSVTINVSGPSLTLTPTAAQIAALQSVVDAVNANERKELPPWTVNQWLQFILVGRVQSATAARQAKDAGAACEAFKQLTAAKQKAITDELGGKAPCL